MLSNAFPRNPSNQQHVMPAQFNESLHQSSDIMHHGNISGSNISFLPSNGLSGGDNHQPKTVVPVTAPQGPPPNTISLATLIDFVVYKTYHDITVMADILPSKTDMDRKTTIVEFSARTRQLFIRLLSLVKWASSVGKVVRCSESSTFLDRQAMLFIDAADKLHILANQVVVQARLPNFAIPAAVDVLTTGTYPRLPLSIRERIIPPDPIKSKEKKATLKRIEQIMLYRLVTEFIPPQIVEVKVEHGVVHLHVPNEFKAYITLMGDGATIPWRLLKLEFLVEDMDVGSGRALIHSLQVNYIHELVQSRLFTSEKPLKDMYDLLHSFCLSLQLEVLHAQADRLVRLRWGKFIQIEEYAAGQKLTVSYWRLNPHKNQLVPPTITIRQSLNDPSKPLQVQHSPTLALSDVDLVESCSHINSLLLEYLIHRSICTRSFQLLTNLKELLHKHIRRHASHFSREEGDKHSALYVPLLDPWTPSECLRIFVDPQTGVLLPSLQGVPDSMLEKMEKDINTNQSSILQWFVTLRDHLAMQRCKKAVQHLPVLYLDQIQTANDSSHSFGSNCFFLKILQHPSYYLVVEITSTPDRPTCVQQKYSFLATSIKTADKKQDVHPGNPELNIVHVHEVKSGFLVGKKTMPLFMQRRASKTTHISENSVELAHMVAVCNSHIPFVRLLNNLEEKQIEHQGIQEEGGGLSMVCHVLELPDIPLLSSEANKLLRDAVRQCSFRLTQRGQAKFWSVELVMKESPVKGDLPKHNGPVVHVGFTYDASSHVNAVLNKDIVKLFLDDWTALGNLFASVLVFSEQLQHPANLLSKLAKVYSYTYKTVTIKYGKGRSFFVSISWSPEKKFQLAFGRSGQNPSSNAHCLVRHYLTEQFNSHPDIGALMHVLHDTCLPLQALGRLPCTPMLGVIHKGASAEQAFTIIPLTATHIRVIFLSVYCIDVYCRADGYVMLRDGSFSQFDFAKIKSSLVPIPGFVTFLSKYRDAKDVQHHADSARDNPPSPNPTLKNQQYGLQELPHATYSGAGFTLLPHASLDSLCTPCPPAMNVIRPSYKYTYTACPLEQFLGAALTRHFLNRSISNTDNVSNIPMAQVTSDGTDTSLASAFVARSLQYVCRPHPQDLRKLILKVSPTALSQPHENWSSDDLLILEKFFELRIICSPYRQNSMKSFFNMISAPTPVLRDFIQLMRIELTGGRIAGFSPKWLLSLYLTAPPREFLAPVGTPSIVVKDKVLAFIQLSQPSVPQNKTSFSIVVPILHEPSKGTVSVLPQGLSVPRTVTPPHHQPINNLFARVNEMNRQNQNETNISFAVRTLMENLTLTS